MALRKLKLPAVQSESRTDRLTVQEEERLSRRWRTLNDRAALQRMISTHLGLVIGIARRFRNAGPPLEDLIQEGNVGLAIAATRFDPSAGTRLATYACYWIRACMLELVIRSHGAVRIGTTRSQRKIFFGLGRARRGLERAGRPVSDEALAEVLGVGIEDVRMMTPRLLGRDQSLDAPCSTHDDRDHEAKIFSDAESAEDRLALAQEKQRRSRLLRQALEALDSRERTIIIARHLDETPATLEELGQRLGVSRERIRQLEIRALKQLRAGMSAPELAM